MTTATLTTPPQTQTPPPAAAAAPPAAVEEPPFGGLAALRRFTVDEYHQMLKAGILYEGEPVELLEGLVVTKMPRGPDHEHAIRTLNYRLVRMLPDGWVVGPQTAATLTDSEPEPDFTVARGEEAAFADRHPGPADIALLIEVSDSSLRRDTRDKGRIYARAGVPVYWIVSIPDRRVDVLTDPSGPADAPAYATRTEYPHGAAVPVVLDGVTVGTITVADVIR